MDHDAVRVLDLGDALAPRLISRLLEDGRPGRPQLLDQTVAVVRRRIHRSDWETTLPTMVCTRRERNFAPGPSFGASARLSSDAVNARRSNGRSGTLGQMADFAYHPAITDRFPAIRGGVIHADGLRNGPAPAPLREAFEAEQRATLARIGETPLSEIPSIAAWRRAFRAFGVDPTAYRSAAEALLRRLTKQGSIPSINALVDIGNLVSIRHALPVAVFDQRAVTGTTTVRFASGHETFTDLGSGERESPEAGEVIFVDDAGLVCARRWCWRQSAESASRAETTEILVTVEGHHDGAAAGVEAASHDLEALLVAYASPESIASRLI
jgi:DNA/RNA-binding domain of Phe-tRNA-synthetase-like protein